MKKIIFLIIIVCLIFAGFINPFRSVSSDKKIETFIVNKGLEDETLVIRDLREKGFIRSSFAINLVLTIKNKHNKTKEGGFYLSKSMDTWQIVEKITGAPDLKWITFIEGLRKEQVGERLQKLLGWDSKELNIWNNLYKDEREEYFEGVYFPDTYLIPIKESPVEVADRMIAHFNEKLAIQLIKFNDKNILWTTGIKIASIIQREAGGASDMPLIAGVIWNRLEKGQKLQMDATIQYAKGKVNGKWWSVVTGSDIRNTDSLYNTYQYKGLPPHPIANPGISAVNAVLNPEETDCMYYLHDYKGQIHCSVTYEEHVENIKKYLN